MAIANENPELIETFCSDGIKDAIPDFLKVSGYSVENPNPNGNVLNKVLNMIFEQLNHQKNKGFSFWEAGKAYVATANNIDIVRRDNKVYFAIQDSNADLVTPKDPKTNPDFWSVLYDFDNPTLDRFSNYTLTSDLIALLNLKADKTVIGNTFDKPNQSALFVKTTPTIFIIPSGFKVRVGSSLVELTSSYELNLDSNLDTGVKVAGTDYYVYAKADSTFYISANKAITADRLIGGFHYGLVPEAEALTGNKTESDMVAIRGINAYSFWDLKFRPVANPEGMVFIGGRWYDIYLLNSEHILNGTSKANAVIAGGVADSNGRAIPKIPLEFGGDGSTTYGKFTWFQANEIAKAHSKQLISYGEFTAIAYGVVEAVSSSTTGEEVVIGKVEHYPSFVSKYGIEQASGVQWLWGADTSALANSPSYQAVTDGRGSIYANASELNAVLLGGYRGNGVYSGSRASFWYYYVWSSNWSLGSRFACDHLELV